MERRDLLKSLSTGCAIGIAGCQDNASSTDSPQKTEQLPTDTSTVDQTQSEDTTDTTEISTESDRSKYYVAPSGDDSNSGGENTPLATIHYALHEAGPGDTIKVESGEYFEDHSSGDPLRTIRPGRPEAPITITGPADAILRPSFEIRHSHVHLTGLTIEGLLDPDKPDDPDAYHHPIRIWPMLNSNDYLENIICAPHGVGYGAYGLIRVVRTKDLEIGPLKVTGLAGAKWLLPETPNRHAGEIIYLGAPPGMFKQEINIYPWSTLDQTRNVHIHHIDNSAGHPHSELVDAKIGTRNVLVEYCTDGDGSQNTESSPTRSIAFDGYDSTLRWCKLQNGEGQGIVISGDTDPVFDWNEVDVEPDKMGTGNAIYGNQITGFPEEDIMIYMSKPEDQELLCGNEMDGVYSVDHDNPPQKEDHDPGQSCPSDIPEGNGIGHTGGDSPWQ